MDNPEKPATQGTSYEEKQNKNIIDIKSLWTILCKYLEIVRIMHQNVLLSAFTFRSTAK